MHAYLKKSSIVFRVYSLLHFSFNLYQNYSATNIKQTVINYCIINSLFVVFKLFLGKLTEESNTLLGNFVGLISAYLTKLILPGFFNTIFNTLLTIIGKNNIKQKIYSGVKSW